MAKRKAEIIMGVQQADHLMNSHKTFPRSGQEQQKQYDQISILTDVAFWKWISLIAVPFSELLKIT